MFLEVSRNWNKLTKFQDFLMEKNVEVELVQAIELTPQDRVLINYGSFNKDDDLDEQVTRYYKNDLGLLTTIRINNIVWCDCGIHTKQFENWINQYEIPKNIDIDLRRNLMIRIRDVYKPTHWINCSAIGDNTVYKTEYIDYELPHLNLIYFDNEEGDRHHIDANPDEYVLTIKDFGDLHNENCSIYSYEEYRDCGNLEGGLSYDEYWEHPASQWTFDPEIHTCQIDDCDFGILKDDIDEDKVIKSVTNYIKHHCIDILNMNNWWYSKEILNSNEFDEQIVAFTPFDNEVNMRHLTVALDRIYRRVLYPNSNYTTRRDNAKYDLFSYNKVVDYYNRLLEKVDTTHETSLNGLLSEVFGEN